MRLVEQSSFRRGDASRAWEEEAATAIGRVALANVLTGFALGFMAGAAAVGLLVTL